MNEHSNRALLLAGLSANVLLLMLSLLDFALNDSQYMWPLFVAWAFVILLLVILALATWRERQSRDDRTTPALARAVAALATRPTERAPVAAPAAKPVVDFEAFPFVYNGYTLYSRSVKLNGGGERTIWFFSKRIPSSGEKAAKPAGYHVGVNERTGLPFLKKGSGPDGEDLTPEQEKAYRPQCSALTSDGAQCRNSSREGSKYCASHFGYQPPTEKGLAKRIEGESWSPKDKRTDKSSVKGADTKPAVKRASDTKVSVRRRSAS